MLRFHYAFVVTAVLQGSLERLEGSCYQASRGKGFSGFTILCRRAPNTILSRWLKGLLLAFTLTTAVTCRSGTLTHSERFARPVKQASITGQEAVLITRAMLWSCSDRIGNFATCLQGHDGKGSSGVGNIMTTVLVKRTGKPSATLTLMAFDPVNPTLNA